MSERTTSIRPRDIAPEFKGRGIGFTSHGRENRTVMLSAYRRHYEIQAETAAYALSLTDDDLIVTTQTGVWVTRNEREVTE